MKRQAFFGFLVLASTFLLSGCVARTYPLTRDRIDQDLNSGNQGYLAGNAPESSEVRKTERTVRVFELELGAPFKGKGKTCDTGNQNLVPSAGATDSSMDSAYSSQPLVSASAEKYTVAKNDTLQKISKKFYGTSKKWMKIYDANRDTLKGPDKLYPGQVLVIPDADSGSSGALLSEPKENLK